MFEVLGILGACVGLFVLALLITFGPGNLKQRSLMRMVPAVAEQLALRHHLHPSLIFGGSWEMGGWISERGILARGDDMVRIIVWPDRYNPFRSVSSAAGTVGMSEVLRLHKAIPELTRHYREIAARHEHGEPDAKLRRGWSLMARFFERWAPYLARFEASDDRLSFEFAVRRIPKKTKEVKLIRSGDVRELVSQSVDFAIAFEDWVNEVSDNDRRSHVPVNTCEKCEIPLEGGRGYCLHCARQMKRI